MSKYPAVPHPNTGLVNWVVYERTFTLADMTQINPTDWTCAAFTLPMATMIYMVQGYLTDCVVLAGDGGLGSIGTVFPGVTFNSFFVDALSGDTNFNLPIAIPYIPNAPLLWGMLNMTDATNLLSFTWKIRLTCLHPIQ